MANRVALDRAGARKTPSSYDANDRGAVRSAGSCLESTSAGPRGALNTWRVSDRRTKWALYPGGTTRARHSGDPRRVSETVSSRATGRPLACTRLPALLGVWKAAWDGRPPQAEGLPHANHSTASGVGLFCYDLWLSAPDSAV